ncbi:hypothetical protein QAD02_002038 [Eretmocerus hayati]|uniref:Uncharacterized protein n=1 Tax=Eretmocerus hayati TaxID=131215 RepID=A0ACC2NHQ9_9HYME|nr:hypothetical protein QAD02_002038 [Eretmocerus hayati]
MSKNIMINNMVMFVVNVEKFLHLSSLDQHCQLHQPSLVKKHACTQCPRKFKHKTELNYHARSTHKPLNPIICQRCNLTLKNAQDKWVHDIHKHPFILDKGACSFCDKLIPRYRMREHLQEHNIKNNKEPFTCREGQEPYATEEMLEKHIQKSHHPRECEQSDFVYSSRYLYEKHKSLIHGSIDGVIVCECSRTFVSTPDFKKHLQSHCGERLHECELCDKKYKSQKDLKQHKESIHKDKRPYKCNSCSRAFSRVSSKMRHEKTHSDEKNHTCTVEFPSAGFASRWQQRLCRDQQQQQLLLTVNKVPGFAAKMRQGDLLCSRTTSSGSSRRAKASSSSPSSGSPRMSRPRS